MAEQYYIQRIPSGMLGNSPVWWAKGGNGYTSYLQNAERFSGEDASKLVIDSGKYAMWSCEEVNKRLHLVYDIQDKKNLGTDNPCGFGGVYATNPDEVASVLEQRDALLHALKLAREFIANGIELGYIRMPDLTTPDPAHETLPLIEAIIAKVEAA